MPRVSSETITLRPTERKKRERATTENARGGATLRERERERNWKIHFGRDKREELFAPSEERERHFVRERKDKKNSLFVKRERGTREKVF